MAGKALESEALFNPEKQAALAFQESKEGTDVCIGGRVRACLVSLNAVLPSPKPLTPVLPAPSPRRRAGPRAQGSALEGLRARALEFSIFNPEKQATLAFQESKEGNDVCIGGRVRACLVSLNAVLPSPKPLTPVPPAPSPRHRAGPRASGKGSGRASGRGSRIYPTGHQRAPT